MRRMIGISNKPIKAYAYGLHTLETLIPRSRRLTPATPETWGSTMTIACRDPERLFTFTYTQLVDRIQDILSNPP